MELPKHQINGHRCCRRMYASIHFLLCFLFFGSSFFARAASGPFNNAAALSYSQPGLFCSGPSVTQDIKVKIGNRGTNQISNVTIGWEVDGMGQMPVYVPALLDTVGGLHPSDSLLTIGYVAFPTTAARTIRVWTYLPNGTIDTTRTDDTLQFVIRPAVSGTFTIGTSGADFTNLTTAIASLQHGICGPVVFNYITTNHAYTERVVISEINGASSTNTITINGYGNTIQASGVTANRDVIKLNGAKYVIIDSLVVKTLATNFGWGIHFTASANHNTIRKCIIDIGSVTSSTAAASAGIVFSSTTNSFTSAASAGNNGAFNLIDSNVIRGNAAGSGMNTGIALTPAPQPTSSLLLNYTGNVISNNTIRDFYAVGIYAKFTNGTVFRNNLIENTTKTVTDDEIYGISMNTQFRNDSIVGNTIRALSGASTAAEDLYGIYFTGGSTPQGSDECIVNNAIYDFKSTGSQYGIYSSNGTNAKYYHNTILLDDAAASASVAAGFYYTGSTSGNGIDFRNNIVSVTRAGTGNKYAVFINSAISMYHFNHNAYWVSGNNAHVGSFAGISYSSLNAWKGARLVDPGSRFMNPDFVSVATGDLTPSQGILDNFAESLNTLTDIKGTVRGSSPDPGAYEFSSSLTEDAGVYEIVLQGGVLPEGNFTPAVRVFNGGTNPLASVIVNWEVNGMLQTPVNFSPAVNPGQISDPLSLLQYTFAAGTPYTIKAWTSLPNFVSEGKPSNDTAWVSGIQTGLPAGQYTINSSAASSATNFQSIDALMLKADSFGITARIEVEIVDTLVQGPVVFNKQVAGSSATNRIIFRGNDVAQTVLSAVSGSAIRISGASHFEFHNIRFDTTFGDPTPLVYIENKGDSNAFVNCRFIFPVSAKSREALYIGSSGSILVDSCVFKGGSSAIRIMGVEGDEDRNNVISNSSFDSIYTEAINAWSQNRFIVRRNLITNIGNGVNTYALGINLRSGINGYVIEKNKVWGMLGGSAINTVFCSAVDGRSVIANNVVRIGQGTNTTLAIRPGSDNNDVVYNTVEVNASGSGNNATCLMVNGTGTNNIFNNILKNTNPGMIFQISATNVSVDNNCYFHNNAQNTPYSLNGATYATLAQLKANGTNDVASLEIDPVFASADLRTYSPILNNKGQAFPSVNTDIQDTLRHATTPDIGAYEYTLAIREDIGVTAITLPSVPVSPGALSDVLVEIQNHGIGVITSADVTYMSGATTYTIPYSGSLAEGETDTVRFSAASGLGLMIPTTGGFTVTAWTSSPNLVADKDFSNDTAEKVYCEPMSGTYTIDTNGTGPRNFGSFTAAVQSLGCGGVSAAVTIEAAPGTYAERIVIPQIPGSSSSNTITFTSATGVASDVLLTDSSTEDADNYVVLFAGTNNVSIRNISIRNEGTGFSRAFFYKTTNGVANENIRVSGCHVSAKPTTVNSTNTALFYAGSEENKGLYVVNNIIENGSAGVYFGGLPVKNQYSATVVVDSNVFTNNAHNAIILSNRNGFEVNRNTIQSTSAAMVNAISLYELCGEAHVSQNNISIIQGAGIRFNRYAFYNEAGTVYVTSNAVLISGTADLGQMGICLMSSSKTRVYNNTVKVSSSKTSPMYSFSANYGLYVQAEPVAANLQNVAAFDNRIVNNIIHTENGYPVYIDDYFGSGGQLSRLAIAEINNNLYHNNNGANVAYILGTAYAKSAFNTFRDKIRLNSDSVSRYVKVPFAAGSVKPVESDTIAWWINGRAWHTAFVTGDVTNKTRAIIPFDGVPDIGAYEITPTSLPPLAVAVPATPAAGITQSFIFLGDTVARIHYSQFGTAPSGVEVRQYVGEIPPLVGPTEKFMYNYVSVNMPAGSYAYDADVIYKDAWTGTMSNDEAGIRMISLDAFSNWSLVPSSMVDAATNILSGYQLTGNSYVLTGTDANDPLPVKLTSFTASKTAGRKVQVSWTVAMERNVSHYVVERSADGVVFTAAAKVAARNASAYQSIDDVSMINASQFYYRLTSVDRDGSAATTKTVKVSFEEARAEIVLAPNPVGTSLNIHLGDLVAKPVTVSVYGLKGEQISEQTYQSVSTVSHDASSLSPGLYFVKVAYGDVVKTIRFVKE